MGRSRGARAISQLLKRLPEDVRGEIIVEMNVVGPQIAAEMRGRTPVYAGRQALSMPPGSLQAGIGWKVLPNSLKLQVGLLGTPGGRAKLFYGRILDLGTNGPRVTKLGWNRGSITALHFVTGSYRDLRSKMTANLKDIWQRALTKASAGSSDQ